jgi:hypothetical protein
VGQPFLPVRQRKLGPYKLPVPHASALKRADFEFSLGQLHRNRPSDQLPWRTHRRSVVDDISAAAAQTCSPLQGESTQSEKRTSAKPADREPSANYDALANALY